MKRLAEDKDLWWVVVGIDGTGKAVVTAEGGTTLDDMKKNHLSDDLLLFGCLKVLGVDTKVGLIVCVCDSKATQGRRFSA